jgi:hypothetical protein
LGKLNYRYLIGTLFVLFGGYQLYLNALLDSALYASLGLGFIVMALIKDQVFPKQQKALNFLSWILIAIGCLSFLYLLTIAPYEVK